MSNTVGKQIEEVTKDQGDAAMASVKTLTVSVQTIAAAHSDYAKKAMENGSQFISKLSSVKEPAKLMELQSEYVKSSYETFMAEAKKISDLYADLLKQTTKPFEEMVSKMTIKK